MEWIQNNGIAIIGLLLTAYVAFSQERLKRRLDKDFYLYSRNRDNVFEFITELYDLHNQLYFGLGRLADNYKVADYAWRDICDISGTVGKYADLIGKREVFVPSEILQPLKEFYSAIMPLMRYFLDIFTRVERERLGNHQIALILNSTESLSRLDSFQSEFKGKIHPLHEILRKAIRKWLGVE